MTASILFAAMLLCGGAPFDQPAAAGGDGEQGGDEAHARAAEAFVLFPQPRTAPQGAGGIVDEWLAWFAAYLCGVS